MTFQLSHIALIGLAYLLLLFGVAYCTDRGFIPERITRHPLTYILSLGIFASAWAFYGIIDLAFQFGYGALAYYLGTGALFLFAPIAIAPLIQLARRFQIGSLADLLVFRYHSQPAGGLVTFCLILGSLPLIALQLQAVADTLRIMTLNSENALPLAESGFTFREVTAMGYCLIVATFTILFGSHRDQHRGLMMTMAFESLVKVFALLAIGLLAVYGVFGGMDELDLWLRQYPENLELLYSPIRDTASHTLLLVFVATAVAMPHIFHMSVVESPIKDTSYTLSWAFPLFLLFMALPIFPILWAGFELGVPLPAQYFTLGIPLQMDSAVFSVIAFIGGLSAASGAMISLGLALSTMLLNHALLPAANFSGKHDLYRQLLWLRRMLIAIIFAAGYLFYKVLGNNHSLTDLALLSFIQALQLLPGILAVAYWPRGNSHGLIIGLSVGTLIWAIGLLLPMVANVHIISIPGLFDIPLGIDYWNNVTIISLSLNVTCFIFFSLFITPSDEERYSAELCAEDELSHPLRTILDVHSAEEFSERLSESLGERSASTEVQRALRDLGLPPNERRPYALRQLRNKLEANLSGLMGTSVASELIDRHIPYRLPEGRGSADINLIENRLTQYRSHLTGMAAELNNLRLYHRNTLEELPMAVCSLGRDMEVLMWNQAMANLTGISSEQVTGSHLDDIPAPWQALLGDFSRSPNAHLHKQAIELGDRQHWISLHKANIAGPAAYSADGQVILLEDVTEIQMLEQELLHSERLASVGRLAAGVAHEIGNPVTGIACLAQNLKYDTENPDALETADQIVSQTDRISRIVQSLVSFSHAGTHDGKEANQLEHVSLKNCADEAIALLSLQKDKTEVNYINRLGEELELRADSQRLIQVFVNLLSNARDASPMGSDIDVSGYAHGQWISCSVTDNGSGIPIEHQEQVLEPFFTSKEPGEGTGLGLAMVYSIVEDHDGELDIESPIHLDPQTGAQTGTRITIKLPRQLEKSA
jgi:PAS domain S-box-containing protein